MKHSSKSMIIVVLFVLLRLFDPEAMLLTSASEVQTDDPKMAEQWYLDQIEATEIWQAVSDMGKEPGGGVVIAVLDTGIDASHAEFQDSLWVNEPEQNGTKGIDDDGNGWVDDIYGYNFVGGNANIQDSSGHGTQMAGIISMAKGNGVGGVGLAYSAKLMIIKVSTNGSFDADTVIKGIEYAVANGADVINMSFGGKENTKELQTALQKAANHCILVAAAGNNGKPTSDSGEFSGKDAQDYFPAGYDSVLGVMSEDLGGTLSEFSNWDSDTESGTSYELAAPGGGLYTTGLKGTYVVSRGTSAAAALVSASAAILRGMYEDREAYPAPVLQKILLENMTHTLKYSFSDSRTVVYPRLNLADMARIAIMDLEIPDTIPPQGQDVTSGIYVLNEEMIFGVKAWDNRSVEKVTLYYRSHQRGSYLEVPMEEVLPGHYETRIMTDFGTPGDVYYFFEISDGTFHTYIGNASETKKQYIYAKWLKDLRIESAKSQIYQGQPCRPVPVLYDGRKVLEEGQDYVVSYEQNDAPGTGYMKITGKGDYQGSVVLDFKIEEKKTREETESDIGISIERCRIEFSNRRYIYNGKVKKPSFLVYDGELCLEENTDYRIVSGTDKKVGEAILTIEGMGKYCGTQKKVFYIVPGKIKKKNIEINHKKKQAVVSWKKVSGGIHGYDIYGASKKNGRYRKIAAVKETSFRMSAKKQKKYSYIKIAAYYRKDGVSLSGEKSAAVKTGK